jgi:hypothetical protein
MQRCRHRASPRDVSSFATELAWVHPLLLKKGAHCGVAEDASGTGLETFGFG